MYSSSETAAQSSNVFRQEAAFLLSQVPVVSRWCCDWMRRRETEVEEQARIFSRLWQIFLPMIRLYITTL